MPKTMGEQRLAELIDGARATSEQDVAVLAGECKRARASEARLIEALKGIFDALDKGPVDLGCFALDDCRAALKEAES